MTDAAAKHARLNLDHLVRDYLENLQINLRGFKAAESFSFLEAWVPHDDPTENVIELLELARSAGLLRLTVVVSAATLARLDVGHLAEIAGAVECRDTADGAELDLDLSLVSDRTARRRSTEVAPTATPSAAAPIEKPFADAPTASANPPGTIHPCYRAALDTVLTDIRHEIQPEPATGQIAVTAKEGPCELFSAIDSKSTQVKQAGFRGAASPIDRGLLEVLCRIMEGRPIQECADHATIAVEYALRDKSQPSPIRGIVTPENADPAFQLPQALVRRLLAEFRSRTGYAATQNFFDRPARPAWIKLSEPDRIGTIAAAMSSSADAADMELVQMDGLKRVVVRFKSGVSSNQMQDSLVRLEDHLRATVEPTLQLTTQVRRDANVLRMPEKKKQ